MFSYQGDEQSAKRNLTQLPSKDTPGFAVNLGFSHFTKDQSEELHENCSIKKSLCQDLLF